MGLSSELSYVPGSFSRRINCHRFFQSEVLRLYFPALEPWVVQSVSLPSCSSQFIYTQMWDCPVHSCSLTWSASLQLAESPSLPLLLIWMNVYSLTPWLSDFHTVQFSVISDCFLFLNLLLFLFGYMKRHSVSTSTSILARSIL